jgi:hypothetical protein
MARSSLTTRIKFKLNLQVRLNGHSILTTLNIQTAHKVEMIGFFNHNRGKYPAKNDRRHSSPALPPLQNRLSTTLGMVLLLLY